MFYAVTVDNLEEPLPSGPRDVASTQGSQALVNPRSRGFSHTYTHMGKTSARIPPYVSFLSNPIK